MFGEPAKFSSFGSDMLSIEIPCIDRDHHDVIVQLNRLTPTVIIWVQQL